MQVQYKFSETEITKLLKENVEIIVDSRENVCGHILDYFTEKKIKYTVKKLDHGDYGIKLTKNIELGLMHDCLVPYVVEKKNSVDELAGSLKERERFKAEFIRAMGSNTKMFLLVEEANGYENILKGKYRSQYDAKALMASLKSFESRYNFGTTFLDKSLSGHFIYSTLLYNLREMLLR